jgi:hypothetical protein
MLLPVVLLAKFLALFVISPHRVECAGFVAI